MKISDADLCALAAATYEPAPEGQVFDWRDCRAVVSGTVAAIRGTVPDIPQNLLRDLQVIGERSRTHAILGPCVHGALDAAEALEPMLPADVNTVTGHSLGGQIAVIIAALMLIGGRPVDLLVTFDAPKAGGPQLVAALSVLQARQYKFSGSIITGWPLFLDRHVREPLIKVDPFVFNPVHAHSINRTVAWLAQNRGGPPVTELTKADINRIVVHTSAQDGRIRIGFITDFDYRGTENTGSVWVRFKDYGEAEEVPRAELSWERRSRDRGDQPALFLAASAGAGKKYPKQGEGLDWPPPV